MYSRYYPEESSHEGFIPASYNSEAPSLSEVHEVKAPEEPSSLPGKLFSGFSLQNLDLGDILLIAIVFLLLMEDGADTTDLLIVAALVFLLGF